MYVYGNSTVSEEKENADPYYFIKEWEKIYENISFWYFLKNTDIFLPILQQFIFNGQEEYVSGQDP